MRLAVAFSRSGGGRGRSRPAESQSCSARRSSTSTGSTSHSSTLARRSCSRTRWRPARPAGQPAVRRGSAECRPRPRPAGRTGPRGPPRSRRGRRLEREEAEKAGFATNLAPLAPPPGCRPRWPEQRPPERDSSASPERRAGGIAGERRTSPRGPVTDATAGC